MKFVYNDGGRFEAGYSYHVKDCVCRALSIISERPYREVQAELKRLDPASPRGRAGYPKYLAARGFAYIPVPKGEVVLLSPEELPSGRIIVAIKEHIAAVIDGVLYDTYDSSVNGTVRIEGYYALPSSPESAAKGKSFILKFSKC
jgi:hypothetical protein